jgi:hypothetical protein
LQRLYAVESDNNANSAQFKLGLGLSLGHFHKRGGTKYFRFVPKNMLESSHRGEGGGVNGSSFTAYLCPHSSRQSSIKPTVATNRPDTNLLTIQSQTLLTAGRSLRDHKNTMKDRYTKANTIKLVIDLKKRIF